MGLVNLTRPPGDVTKYDLRSTVEHEIDEVLGFSSNLPDLSTIGPVDLFRYDTSGQRTFTINGDNAYFSLDGTSLYARFNQDPGGDYHDWWSNNGQHWSPPGTTPIQQVQDAFADPGTFEDLGTNELTVLDAIGYTLIASPLPTLTIAKGPAGEVTISWPNTVSGFVLQETTNLVSGTWSDSPSGAANPAVITATAARKFYRLHKTTSLATAAAVPTAGSTTFVRGRVTHIYRPRQP
jgi:hypothetical protein